MSGSRIRLVDTATRDAAAGTKAAGFRAGAELREARERLGWDLGEVAAALRIKLAYLQAIEDGRISALPGNAYALGFLRTYATTLGLDADEISRRFRSEANDVNRKTDLAFPAPVPERGVPTGALVLIGLVIAAAGYGAWYKLSDREPAPTHTVPAVPDELLPARRAAPVSPQVASVLPPPGTAVPTLPPRSVGAPSTASAAVGAAPASRMPDARMPVGPSAAPAASVGATTGAVAPAAGAPGSAALGSAAPGSAASGPAAAHPAAPGSAAAGSATNGLATPNPLAPGVAATGVAAAIPSAVATAPTATLPSPAAAAAAAALATAAIAPASPGAPVAAPALPQGVVLHANAVTWVQVRAADHHVVWDHVMQPGDTWPAPADTPGLTLTTGNAGGLTLSADGRMSPALGRNGSVRRSVPLDPLAVNALSSAPADAPPTSAAPATARPANAPAGYTPAGNAPAGYAPVGNAPAADGRDATTPAGNAEPAGVAPPSRAPATLPRPRPPAPHPHHVPAKPPPPGSAADTADQLNARQLTH